jgi:CheY-like chemotaxis protein
MQLMPQTFGVPSETKIMIVEDHRDSREALRALFEAYGYQVVEAANGFLAIERAQSERPNLILMDIMMPELDGFDAARRIRALPGHEQTPIIAITALEDAHQLALDAGMSDYVRKPVDIRGLLRKVSVWLEPTTA